MQKQLRPIDVLDAQKAEQIKRIKTLEARQRELKATGQKQIAELRKEADRLAAIFKPMVEQSNAAYAADEKEKAHEIAVERQRITAECKALNAQADALRDELANLPDVIAAAKRELADLKANLAPLEPLRHITIDGFEQAYGMDVQLVSEELGKLPPAILQHVKRVVYVHQFQSTGIIGLTGNKADNPEQTTITLYPTFASANRYELAQMYRETIVHEAGHVLFDWVVGGPHRSEWFTIYTETLRNRSGRFVTDYARKSLREDFGECFMLYIHRPDDLRKLDQTRYAFIDKIYKEYR